MESNEIVLEVNRREIFGRQVKALRRSGKLPAILYGKEMESIPVSMEARPIQRMINQITPSSLIKIDVDGQVYHTLLRDRQINFLTGEVTHLDFLVVSLTETVKTEVALHFDGEAPAVKDFNGVINTSLDSIEVECLPQDLPNRIRVDLTVLKQIGNAILVRDLPIPPKVTVLTHPEVKVVHVTAQSVEADEEIAGSGPELAPEPELIERKRKEEEVE
jgi:large subunit ribosomal protein L25